MSQIAIILLLWISANAAISAHGLLSENVVNDDPRYQTVGFKLFAMVILMLFAIPFMLLYSIMDKRKH